MKYIKSMFCFKKIYYDNMLYNVIRGKGICRVIIMPNNDDRNILKNLMNI